MNQATSDTARSAQIRLLPFLAILLQLGLFLVVLYVYDLESRAFLHLSIDVFFAFIIHYFLPRQLRRPFFAALSVFCLATVFGFQLEEWSLAGLTQAAWIVGLGLGVIGICHLPVAFAVRVLLLLSAGATLTAMRAGFVPVPWSAAVWPVFASMFMFRTAVYLHAMKYDKQPATFVDALCYFFMLPNPCFPLFPVVDFQAFRRTYYDAADRHQIYQTGVTWLFRGATHLLLYRMVYHNLVIDAADVTTVPKLLQYLLWPFLLYLRVSGQFHVIVGMLHLFGFNLPETHRLYYLSSSFTDFWRRINIYWKDFMMKLVFYPSYVRLKRWGPTLALVVAMVVVFTATWLLHAYQWFWIQGKWLLTWNDSLFWALLAVLVIINALYENARGRRRTLSGGPTPWREAALTGVKAIVMFFTICVLWSFWSASSIGEWFSAFRVLWSGDGGDYMRALLLLLAACAAIGVPATLLASNRWQPSFSFVRSAAAVTVGCSLLIAVNAGPVYESLSPTLRGVVAELRQSDLNRRDFAQLQQGYYEELLDVNQFNAELLDVYRTRPADWFMPLRDTAAAKLVDGLPFYELRPNYSMPFLGKTLRTNSWGMRDVEYARARANGTMRIAVVGSSFPMGNGVEGEETFHTLLEDRLNKAHARESYDRYELLNFGVAGYTSLDHLTVVENRVFDFSPQYVFYFDHGDPFTPLLNRLVDCFLSGNAQPYPFLNDMATRIGVKPGPDRGTIGRLFQPHLEEILAWIYRGIVQACEAHGVQAVWIYVPRPEAFERGPSEREIRLAEEAGFQILVLEDVYPQDQLKSFWTRRWDHHPNAAGHQYIAARLYELVQRRLPALFQKPEPQNPTDDGVVVETPTP